MYLDYAGQRLLLKDSETVLQCLLRHGIEHPHSCDHGDCHSCLMQASQGTPPEAAQRGLKPTRKQQGYFLPCIAHPTESLQLSVSSSQRVSAALVSVDPLAMHIAEVTLCLAAPLDYQPGQFIRLIRQDGLARCYSLPHRPNAEGLLHLQIANTATGGLSQWLHENATHTDPLIVEGPFGDGFYVPEMAGQPLLLAGSGTGLAPLMGIVEQALYAQHDAPIFLYHGSVQSGGLYYRNRLASWAEQHKFLSYRACVDQRQPGDEDSLSEGRLDQLIQQDLPNISGYLVFLCGHPGLVRLLQRQCFMAGASNNDIYIDPFVSQTANPG